MFEGYWNIRALVDQLEAAAKYRTGEAAALEHERLALERDRKAFEREKLFDRAMRAVRDHTFG